MIDTSNTALTHWDGPLGLPEFDRISDSEYAAGFEAGFAAHNAEIDKIAAAEDAPTFDNTIVALERAGLALGRVSALFWNRAGADTNETIQDLEREIAPKMSRHYSAIAANQNLFSRINALYESRDTLGLTIEQDRVLERHWKSFVKAGAKLDSTEQNRLAAINEELAGLGANFGQNVLADESSWAMFLTEEAELAGLPPFVRDTMQAAASERGRKGSYAVTLSRSNIEPFLTFSSRRDLREKAYKAWSARGESDGPTHNWPLIQKTLRLRQEKAQLLGYENYAALKLDDTMAKTPAAVKELLETVWEKARAQAKIEEGDIRRAVQAEGGNFDVEPWDWNHYAEKLRAERFDFSEGELKPYLQLDYIIAACFDVANRLFGITLHEATGVNGYHPDVRVFEARDANNTRIGVFLADYFARPSKRSGAWMSGFQGQHKIAQSSGEIGETPIIYNVMNFAKPAEGKPALLSLDDARTLFHEFGHALHGLLSNVTYPSVSGTSVSRDFVELPSQLYEHWLTVPEILKTYAKHAETGNSMPEELLEKVLAARTFNSGFATVEFTASALVDMAMHTAEDVQDPEQFESEYLRDIKLPQAINMRHRSPHFLHIFAGDGYSAGYYSYMWSEVLDADAFEAFEETGNVFDPIVAERLKSKIYSAGGSVDPSEAYQAFRGSMPTPNAMLRKKGLAA